MAVDNVEVLGSVEEYVKRGNEFSDNGDYESAIADFTGTGKSALHATRSHKKSVGNVVYLTAINTYHVHTARVPD